MVILKRHSLKRLVDMSRYCLPSSDASSEAKPSESDRHLLVGALGADCHGKMLPF